MPIRSFLAREKHGKRYMITHEYTLFPKELEQQRQKLPEYFL